MSAASRLCTCAASYYLCFARQQIAPVIGKVARYPSVYLSTFVREFLCIELEGLFPVRLPFSPSPADMVEMLVHLGAHGKPRMRIHVESSFDEGDLVITQGLPMSRADSKDLTSAYNHVCSALRRQSPCVGFARPKSNDSIDDYQRRLTSVEFCLLKGDGN